MSETLKNTDLMTLIATAQQDKDKAGEIKNQIEMAVQDLNKLIDTKQKKLDELDKKSMKIKHEIELSKQTKEMYQNALKNFFL